MYDSKAFTLVLDQIRFSMNSVMCYESEVHRFKLKANLRFLLLNDDTRSFLIIIYFRREPEIRKCEERFQASNRLMPRVVADHLVIVGYLLKHLGKHKLVILIEQGVVSSEDHSSLDMASINWWINRLLLVVMLLAYQEAGRST